MTNEIEGLSEAVLFERVGAHVAMVTLNRPEVRNAVNGDVTRGMEAAIARTEADNQIRVVILAANGERSFCAGADLSVVAKGQASELRTERGGFAGFVRAPRTKPWIAAVNAPALGGGLEFCLTCDMIVAGRSAQFGLPEVKRGLYAGAGGSFRLPRAIPRHVALEMITTGRSIDAQRAYALGLVNCVVDDVRAAALELAEEIAANAPLSIRESLAVARIADDLSEQELWQLSGEAGQRVAASPDSKEGARAFVEKRAPVWSSV